MHTPDRAHCRILQAHPAQPEQAALRVALVDRDLIRERRDVRIVVHARVGVVADEVRVVVAGEGKGPGHSTPRGLVLDALQLARGGVDRKRRDRVVPSVRDVDEAPVAADDISSAKTTESSTFETTSAISNVPEVKGGSTETTGTPFDGTGKTSCKRIVYNRGAQWNVDAKYWENCLQQLEQFGQEQGIVTELVDRPRTGTVVPAGAPAFTLLLNSKPEQPVSDLWLLGQRLDHLLTAEFVGQRNIETLEV